MGSNKKTVEEVFDQAIQFETPEERDAYVLNACADDPGLLARIQELLKHHNANSFLDAPPVDSNVSLGKSPISESPGTIIDRYKLLEKIGEGGMAVVYMAQQEEPIRRKVALKIIKLGMDTKQVIARFEAERQALALMDHLNIAKVLDAGATETGRPYFVMELVTGVSITEYCDQNKLSTKDRLVLFIQVCNAVQHAHQKGIIHRDLKPTNIMVTQHEGQPVPKVIDFGIAKATNQRLTEKTLFTRYAHIIGTPTYMSPEQAELSDIDVDTRSDIYSLGVLLYELLTGTTPFGEEELRKAGYAEMTRIIREQEPAKPSTKLSSLGKTLADVARQHNVSPDLLLRSLRGDLDWIVMKSLEKDRAHRYETANGLGLDVRRHLDNEPVLAHSPSAAYRLQKFFYRNRVSMTAFLAAFVVIVVFGTVVLNWNEDRRQLRQERTRLAEVQSLQDHARLEKARSFLANRDLSASLKEIQPILGSKHVGSQARFLYAGVLVEGRRPDEAVAILEELLDDRPEIAGAAHSLLARILWERPSTDDEKSLKVAEHRRRAEALLPETAEAHFLRALTAITIKEKLEFLDEALRLDPSHYESYRLRAFTHYASRKYEKMERDALAMIVRRPQDSLGHSLQALAWHQLDRYEDANEAYYNAINLTAAEDPQYVELNAQRLDTLMTMGQYNQVIAETREGLERVPDAGSLRFRIFCALTALGNYDEARSVFQRIGGVDPRLDWSKKYVFDCLAAGRGWYPSDSPPTGTVFQAMMDAQDAYRHLSSKARRLITDGFTSCFSPDGKQIAFSAGFHGHSGVALFDIETGQTELLIVPGKDPSWSPDGRFLAFVRDCPVLSLSEFTAAKRVYQHRQLAEEEVWIMRSDGTEPRRLAQGGWPSWSQDSKRVYYQSRKQGMLYSMSIEDRAAQPVALVTSSVNFSSVSPDERHVAYLESGLIKVKVIASQTLVSRWPALSAMWGGAAWSPTGREFILGGGNVAKEDIGLWIYGLSAAAPRLVLSGRIVNASWSADRTQLAFSTGAPNYEIWVAPLDPAVSTVESLDGGQTIQEYHSEKLTTYTRRIDADPNNAEAHFQRAQCYDALGERLRARADMLQWSAILSGEALAHSHCRVAHERQHTINLPFNYELVFSAERHINDVPILSIALGQKGKSKMKPFKIPMFVTPLFGLCLLAGLNTPAAQADFTFGEPVNLNSIIPVIDTAVENPTCFSTDGLEIYLESFRDGGYGNVDLWVLTRDSIDQQWNTPENLGPEINTSMIEMAPCLSSDGLTLCFNSPRSEGYGGHDIYMTSRIDKNSPWKTPVNIGPSINSPSHDAGVCFSSDGLELYFHSNRPGGYGDFDIYVSIRTTTNDPWGVAQNLGPLVNSPYAEADACLSPNGLVLIVSGRDHSPRPGGHGSVDMWMSKRTSLSGSWLAAMNLGPVVNGPANDYKPVFSPDGSAMFFTTERSGVWDCWQVPILPKVDLNSDDKVDAQDMSVLIDHWHSSDPLCDIGPTPWGDGIVDSQDMVVLSEYLEPGFGRIAHWKLDETEGDIAYDSVGSDQANVHGEAVWQPDAGFLHGALAFDGVDDYIAPMTTLNPKSRPFRILAWVKGGAAGQVIASQTPDEFTPGGAYLAADSSDGTLVTDLMISNMPLDSGVVIADGEWHEVGLEWDGERRHLLVNGDEAAVDEVPLPALACAGWLNIGTGPDSEPGSFWSGLIDDVRVYVKGQ